MSWPASYPPPPRHSRSRSPARSVPYGARPPYPDQYPPPDLDPYVERDRAYVGGGIYDRPYDYGRRRSRSPPGDDSRKRRRSASPYDRDRYEPRPRYADDYDAHSRSYDYGSRRGGYGRGRALQDPRTADYPVSLRQYAEWFRATYPEEAIEEDRKDKDAEIAAGDGSKPRNGLKTLWEKYKKEFAQNQLQIMFDHHQKSPWFAEKYDPAPDFEQMRQRLRKEGWKGRLQAFLDDLDAGKYDPETKEAEPTSPTTDAVNGDAEGKVKPEAGDDDMQFHMDTEEDGGDADGNRTSVNGQANGKGPAQPDELAVPVEGNQVMIRTIPPDIGRTKLEEAVCHLNGYHYLALGDPLQKRNFYRAGWIRFHDYADMSAIMNELMDKKIDGFKLHVTHNQRPFTGKIRYAPEVASRPARLAKDLASARLLASMLEDQAAALRQLKVKKPQPPKPEGSTAGEDEPMPEPEYDEEDEEPRERGTDAVERRIDAVMQTLQEQGLVDSSNEKAYEEKKVVVSLDLFIAYLRAAFHTCFYCCVVTDHVEELQRKCVKHERKPLSAALLEELKAEEAEKEAQAKKEQGGGDEAMDVKEEGGEEGKKEEDAEKMKERKDRRKEGGRDWKRNDERWLEWHDSKFALLVNRDEVDPRDYGGKNYDEELSKAVEPYIKREEEHKFRCKSCQKLFKATTFVEKHIANKHPDLIKGLEDLPYFNNFALDPHRIQPFNHPPPSVGNQAPPPQAYGLQASAQYAQPDYDRNRYPDPYGPPPPMYMNGRGGYDMPYMGGGGGGYGGYPPGPPIAAGGGRRLAERMGGYAEPPMGLPPPGAGLPAKPMHLLEGPLMAGNGPMMGAGARRGRGGGSMSGPPPPPPPDAKEDPRAARGARVSYHDMDEVAEGDIQLQY